MSTDLTLLLSVFRPLSHPTFLIKSELLPINATIFGLSDTSVCVRGLLLLLLHLFQAPLLSLSSLPSLRRISRLCAPPVFEARRGRERKVAPSANSGLIIFGGVDIIPRYTISQNAIILAQIIWPACVMRDQKARCLPLNPQLTSP